MTKRQLIDEIIAINPTATPSFLARFQDDDLDQYLTHLRVLSTPRLSGEPGRYEKYFRNCPAIQYTRPQWRTTMVAESPDEDEQQPVEEFADRPYEDDLDEPARPAAKHKADALPVPFAEDNNADDEEAADQAEETLIELAAFIPDADADADDDEEAVESDPPAVELDALQVSPADAQDAADLGDDEDDGETDEGSGETLDEDLHEAPQPVAAAPASIGSRAVAGPRDRRKKPSPAPLFADKQEDSETWLY